jgi:hypothetical protein
MGLADFGFSSSSGATGGSPSFSVPTKIVSGGVVLGNSNGLSSMIGPTQPVNFGGSVSPTSSFIQGTPKLNTSGYTSGVNPSSLDPFAGTIAGRSTSGASPYGAPANLKPPTIPDATPVQAHLAELVQMSAARIGAFQNAIAERAQAAQIGKMDQITAATLNREDELKIRAEQVALNEQLKAVVAGTAGPSVAELQYQRTSEQAARQQMGYAAARGTGGNYGLAMREAAQNQGLIQAQQSQGAAELRAQEVATARGQMVDLQSQIRAADIAVATTEANYRQQANMFNAEQVNQAKIRQAELNNQINALNAQLGTQVSMFNTGQQNQRTMAQAEMEQQASMFNAGQANDTNRFNASSQNSADQFNSSMASQVAQTRAQITSTYDQFNATDARIRQMAEADRRQQLINQATQNNFTQVENQKNRDAQAAKDALESADKERDRVNRTDIANISANASGSGAGGLGSSKGSDSQVFWGNVSGGAALGGKAGPWGALAGAAGGALIGGFNVSSNGRDKAKAQGEAVAKNRAANDAKRAALIAAGKNPADYPTSEGGDRPDGSGNDPVIFGSAEEAAGPPADDGKRWYNPFSW